MLTVTGLWRYGYVNVSRVTTEELRHIDTAALYLTSKRLLFNGQEKNVSIPFADTPYRFTSEFY